MAACHELDPVVVPPLQSTRMCGDLEGIESDEYVLAQLEQNLENAR